MQKPVEPSVVSPWPKQKPIAFFGDWQERAIKYAVAAKRAIRTTLVKLSSAVTIVKVKKDTPREPSIMSTAPEQKKEEEPKTEPLASPTAETIPTLIDFKTDNPDQAAEKIFEALVAALEQKEHTGLVYWESEIATVTNLPEFTWADWSNERSNKSYLHELQISLIVHAAENHCVIAVRD